MNEKRGKHLTLEDRIEIQECLTHGMTFKAIGQHLKKDQTTISKEVKRHIKVHTNSFVKRDDCCPRLLKAPFVCNGCQNRSRSCCQFARHLYEAKTAQIEYETLLTESREGIALNKESFYQTEEIISNGVRKGQHLYHIMQTHKLAVSSATVYRYIHNGYYSIANIDLPRVVKFKPRYLSAPERVPKAVKNGRTYEEFQEFCDTNSIHSHVELDTVIGSVGGKVIMTLHFTAFNFMIGILLDNKTSAEVARKMKALKQQLADNGFSFSQIFPLLLTDNGGEFSCVDEIENNGDEPQSKLFFCDPHMPSEKAHIEKNHTLFRDIVHKGASFDSFTQDTVNLIFSHINAVKRSKFNGKSAYDLFCFSYSRELASALGISFIPAELVVQSPALLKK